MPIASPPNELLHFCAHTPHGAMHLELPARHGSDAVGAALALGDAHTLLTALEQWLALTLDPAPRSPACADATEPAPGLIWCSTADNAHLGMPWQLLAQAPPSGMPALFGPELALRVVVARWPQVQHLPPPATAAGGGLLLLPASFAESWCVSLVQPELGFEVDAHWAGPGHAPTVAGAPRALSHNISHDINHGVTTVQLLHSLQWPLAAVLGWCQAPETTLGDAAQVLVHDADGVDPAAQQRKAAVAISGRIVPALGGAGLLVTGPAVVAAVPRGSCVADVGNVTNVAAA
jgi:hypothetical protein